MKRRLTPSMVVSLVALAVALSGPAVAATEALITGAQIKDKSIGLNDISNTAIAKLRGQRGPQGPDGPEGPQGAPGANGGFDPAKVVVVQGNEAFIGAYSVASSTAACPAGTKVLGGGFTGTADPFISAPSGEAWHVAGSTSFSAGARIKAYAICGAP